MHGLQQVISQQTHLLQNSLFYIDLIFTDQLNLAVDSGFHPSLHPNCHHQIIFCKFNLMIEYEHLVWDYKHSDENAIAKAFDQVDWNFQFLTKMPMNKSVFITELWWMFFQISFQIN